MRAQKLERRDGCDLRPLPGLHNGGLPDAQHCLVSQQLPTELFSSAPLLHAAIFLVLFFFFEGGGGDEDDPKALPHAHAEEHASRLLLLAELLFILILSSL